MANNHWLERPEGVDKRAYYTSDGRWLMPGEIAKLKKVQRHWVAGQAKIINGVKTFDMSKKPDREKQAIAHQRYRPKQDDGAVVGKDAGDPALAAFAAMRW
jgi:hypothetical protein